MDFETSGLCDNHSTPLDKQPSAIELYMCEVDMDSGEVLREFDSLFKPPQSVSDEIIRITGIDNEMLKDAPAFAEKANEAFAFIESSEVICAHNLSFDREIFVLEADRLGRIIQWPKRLICTVEATIHYKGYRLSLAALHELLFKERFPEAHRAKNDVMALVRCAIELNKRGDV